MPLSRILDPDFKVSFLGASTLLSTEAEQEMAGSFREEDRFFRGKGDSRGGVNHRLTC